MSDCSLSEQAENPPAEVWLPIPGYEGVYDVSDRGRVRSLRRGLLLKPFLSSTNEGDSKRYLAVALWSSGAKKTLTVHRLVLLAFVGPLPSGMVTRHLNGDAHDNRLENLRYGTRAENWADAVAHGTLPCKGRRPQASVCPKGHEYQPNRPPGAECRVCATDRMRRWRASKKV